MTSSINGTFSISPVTEEETIKIVTCLNNTGAGYDNIPIFIHKNNISILSKIITYICNLSFSRGIFPSDLAVARMKCIYEAGEKNDPASYRPISILPSSSKILEKKI